MVAIDAQRRGTNINVTLETLTPPWKQQDFTASSVSMACFLFLGLATALVAPNVQHVLIMESVQHLNAVNHIMQPASAHAC